MKSSTALKIINPLLFFVVVLQFAGIVAQKIMYADWLLEMHEIVGYSIGALALVHIIFNWNWIKNNFLKFKKK